VTRPTVLDLFSKAGGMGMGFHLAGFDVVGVDREPQPNYPFTFHQGDALEFLAEHGADFDVVHASPPCQDYSATRSLHAVRYPRLIAPVRLMLRGMGHPLWVIENVERARRHMIDPVRLCGSSFGLGVRRHRLFETSVPLGPVPACAHHTQPEPIDVTGTGARRAGPRTDGRGGNSRKPRNLAEARAAMGVDWMTRKELSEAVPPVYARLIAERFAARLHQLAA
jgi:DNA (cytosine-5)-methyltransferase 1